MLKLHNSQPAKILVGVIMIPFMPYFFVQYHISQSIRHGLFVKSRFKICQIENESMQLKAFFVFVMFDTKKVHLYFIFF